MPNQPDNVIQFVRDPKIPVKRSDTSHERCRHERTTFTVDHGNRSVTCQKCGGKVDAFDALATIAEGWERYEWEYERLRNSLKTMRDRLEHLKREERNTTARLRRARRAAT